jgi:hypothetical protein
VPFYLSFDLDLVFFVLFKLFLTQRFRSWTELVKNNKVYFCFDLFFLIELFDCIFIPSIGLKIDRRNYYNNNFVSKQIDYQCND